MIFINFFRNKQREIMGFEKELVALECYTVAYYYYGKHYDEQTLKIVGVYRTLGKAKQVFKKCVRRYKAQRETTMYDSDSKDSEDDEISHKKWNGKREVFAMGTVFETWCCKIELQKLQ